MLAAYRHLGELAMRHLLLLCLLFLPSLLHAADFRGLWAGYYAYEPGTSAVERVECAMVLEQINAEVGGVMIERQTFGDSLLPGLPSNVLGTVSASGIVFEKLYFHDGDDATTVIYELSVSPDGNTLSGFWRLGEVHGTAFFRRVTAASAERIPSPR